MSQLTKLTFMLVSAFALSVANPVLANAVEENAAPVHHRRHHYENHHHHHHAASGATVVAPGAAVVAPTGEPAIDHHTDGLSRDGDDCNMGCIDETN